MTAISDYGRVVGDWLLQSAGYNSTSGVLTDRSGLGNHPTRTGTAPTFTTHSSISGMVMGVANTRFSCPSFMPAPVTIIAVMHTLLDAADNIGLLLALPESYGNQQAPHPTGDPAWETADATSVYEGAAKYIQLYLRGSDNTARLNMRTNSANPEAATAYTNDAWQVVQCVINPTDLLLKLRIGTGSIATAAINSANFGMYPSETFYVDKRSTGITTSGGKHCTLARLAILNGDSFTDDLAGLNTLVTSLVANPAL